MLAESPVNRVERSPTRAITPPRPVRPAPSRPASPIRGALPVLAPKPIAEPISPPVVNPAVTELPAPLLREVPILPNAISTFEVDRKVPARPGGSLAAPVRVFLKLCDFWGGATAIAASSFERGLGGAFFSFGLKTG